MINKILVIITPEQRIKIVFFTIIATFLAVLDAGSVIILGPVVKAIYGDSNIGGDELNLYFQQFFSNQIIPWLIIFCLYIYVKNLLNLFFQKKLIKGIFEIKSDLSSQLFYRYINKEYSFYIKNNSANLINNITNVTSVFSQHSLMGSINLLAEALVVFFILGYFLYIQPLGMIITTLFIGAIIFLINVKNKKSIKINGYKRKKYETNALKDLHRSFAGVKEVKVFGAEDYFMRRFSKSTCKASEYESEIQLKQLAPKLWFETVGIFSLSILLITSIYAGVDKSDLLVLIAIFSAGAFRLIPAMSRLIGSMQLVRSSNYAINILFNEFKSSNISHIERLSSLPLNNFLDLKINKLSFNYDNTSKKIIKDFSTVIKIGEVVCLDGPSGSGKTTLISLIMGMLLPSQGSILINNIDISKCRSEWLKLVGYVPQSIYLSDQSILENIIFPGAIDQINYDCLDYAIRVSKVGDFISDLPNGLNTNLGDFGTRLSGGQKQRIAIARALYRKPKFVIFDEATTGVDAEIENEIFSALDYIKRSAAILVVSHNEKIKNKCDRLLLL
jgi:ABC-type multidrug transport system fused ATPase/permease subunit